MKDKVIGELLVVSKRRKGDWRQETGRERGLGIGEREVIGRNEKGEQ